MPTIEHHQSRVSVDSHSFILVNKYAFVEVATAVAAMATRAILESQHELLFVRRAERDGIPYVAVMGDIPDRETRRELARIFSVGEPVDEPEQNISGLFQSSST